METMKMKTLFLDIERGTCELDGVDISKNTSELHLDFENGVWSLAVTQKTVYTASDEEAKEST